MTPEEVLNKGLALEFRGETHDREIKHGSIILSTASATLGGTDTYSDIYTGNPDSKSVVGLETANATNSVGEMEAIGRVYAGGTISKDKLLKLGIQKSDVGKFLYQIITTLKVMRLDSPISFTSEEWEYKYSPEPKHPVIEIYGGLEEIFYKGHCVFAHKFLVAPIEG